MSKKSPKGVATAIGLCLGVVLGLLLNNLGLFIALGLLTGGVFDLVRSRKKSS